ncbi:MAG: DUF58 domain-containing protein [Alphaproteobacteria bacterium]|nr:DUF58 domain-containing protein [Alphaproteobacteria bacterium]
MATSGLFPFRPRTTGDEAVGPRLLSEAEAAGAGVQSLLVAAERVAATVSLGVHGRRRAGQGETFWQFRPYDDTDAPGEIDWRQSAASDGLYVRELEWEAIQSIYLWADQSPSMAYRSHPDLPAKRTRALLCALAAGFLLTRAGERIGLAGVRGAGGAGRLAVHDIAQRLEAGEAPKALPDFAELPRHGCVLLFSDFLYDEERMARAIETLGSARIRGHLVQILDPSEEDWPFEGRTEFLGLGAGEQLLAGKAEALRERYRHRLTAHRARLGALARKAGLRLLAHRTDERPERLLLALAADLADHRPSHDGPGQFFEG